MIRMHDRHNHLRVNGVSRERVNPIDYNYEHGFESSNDEVQIDVLL